MTAIASTLTSSLGIFGLPGGGEWIVLLILGLLIFGRRLPEVGRSIGKSIVEFKRGIKDIEHDVDRESAKPSPRSLPEDDEHSLPEADEATRIPKSEQAQQHAS